MVSFKSRVILTRIHPSVTVKTGESTLTTTSLTILFSGLQTEYPVSQSHTSIHVDILNMT